MQITIRMPDEYGRILKQLSKKTGLRRSDIIRLAMRQFIEGNPEVKDRHPHRVVNHLLGIVESGIPDLGQSHRRYLIDQIKKGTKS
jgi:metal-responsive CopG/Arc/MetJ family transcriptional regulator